MKHPLFKKPEDKLSPQEEMEITKELSEAYLENERSEKRPEFQRIAKNIEGRIRSAEGTE